MLFLLFHAANHNKPAEQPIVNASCSNAAARTGGASANQHMTHLLLASTLLVLALNTLNSNWRQQAKTTRRQQPGCSLLRPTWASFLSNAEKDSQVNAHSSGTLNARMWGVEPEPSSKFLKRCVWPHELWPRDDGVYYTYGSECLVNRHQCLNCCEDSVSLVFVVPRQKKRPSRSSGRWGEEAIFFWGLIWKFRVVWSKQSSLGMSSMHGMVLWNTKFKRLHGHFCFLNRREKNRRGCSRRKHHDIWCYLFAQNTERSQVEEVS